MKLFAVVALSVLAVTAHAAMPDMVYGWETLAQKQMAKTLKDSGSAKYKNVHAYALTAKNGDEVYIFCGSVNARNGFGVCMGYQRFIATPAFVRLKRQMNHPAKMFHMICNSRNDVGEVRL